MTHAVTPLLLSALRLPIEFYQHGVIHFRAEGFINRAQVEFEAVRCYLRPLREPPPVPKSGSMFTATNRRANGV